MRPRTTLPIALVAVCAAVLALGIVTGVKKGNDRTGETASSRAGDQVGGPAATDPIRINYGSAPSQFGDLWLPPAGGPVHPIVVLIHGGYWRVAYGLDLMEALATDLTTRGYAVWNIEYRRVGEVGGGYPGTFDDVASAIDKLATLAPTHGLDLDSVTVVGHSAGGHLALWAAGRSRLVPDDPGAAPIVPIQTAIGLGPVVGLTMADAPSLSNGAVLELIGGTVSQFPDRYRIATPVAQPGASMWSVRGVDDTIVPERFTVPSGLSADRLVDVPGDHFALIDPSSQAWKKTVELIARDSPPQEGR